ncbi:MAG: carboxypeptidase-like regulatory domain-containing protein [Candidatus Solibacter sp.]|nr:carboxypeptidase-like regulatory domain-containing protein [Candidatus Solibacter sp.]
MLRPLMFCLLAGLVVPSGALRAQSSNASLSGVVLDPAGAVVPAAQLTLLSLGTGMASRTQTAADGSYSFPSAPAGQYELKASAKGFKDFRQQGIQLSLFEKARVEVRLEIGSSTETVEVRADASMVNFETAEQRGGIAPETMGELPLVVSNGVRSSAGFLTLLPGSSAPTGDVGSARINGGVQYAGEAILNGSALLNPAGQQGIISAAMDFAQSPDMVSELKVLQANYEPQYGSTGGAIIIMETKSGTNRFHGTAFEFLRNTAMNARQFNVAQRPKDIENDFGVFIGGPMKLPVATSKFNKTYFFFNWEGFRQRGALTRPTLTIPSLKQRQGDFSDWVDVTGKLILPRPLRQRLGATVGEVPAAADFVHAHQQLHPHRQRQQLDGFRQYLQHARRRVPGVQGPHHRDRLPPGPAHLHRIAPPGTDQQRYRCVQVHLVQSSQLGPHLQPHPAVPLQRRLQP